MTVLNRLVLVCLAYVELNPGRAGLVARPEIIDGIRSGITSRAATRNNRVKSAFGFCWSARVKMGTGE